MADKVSRLPVDPPKPSTLTAAVEASLRDAYRAGALSDADSAAVQALRLLARRLDEYTEDDWRRDNVSLSVYHKFCESLGFTPMARARATGAGGAAKDKGPKHRDKLEAFRTITGAS